MEIAAAVMNTATATRGLRRDVGIDRVPFLNASYLRLLGEKRHDSPWPIESDETIEWGRYSRRQ